MSDDRTVPVIENRKSCVPKTYEDMKCTDRQNTGYNHEPIRDIEILCSGKYDEQF